MRHVKSHWKKYALVALAATAGYYGVDYEAAKSAAAALLAVFGL